jgi:hypothetical protein
MPFKIWNACLCGHLVLQNACKVFYTLQMYLANMLQKNEQLFAMFALLCFTIMPSFWLLASLCCSSLSTTKYSKAKRLEVFFFPDYESSVAN